MQRPTIAIIGPGRAGSALGRALHAAGYSVAAIGGRNPESIGSLAQELGARACPTPAAALELADLTLLAVPDDVIGEVAAAMAANLAPDGGKAAVHLSGAQGRDPLQPLAKAGVRIGVFHPLQTFRRGLRAARNVPGSYIGVDADPPLRVQLTAMAGEIGGHAFDLAGIDRALYHAAAVFAANYPVMLVAEAAALARAAGLDKEAAERGMTTLLAGAVANLQNTNPDEALTGPAARGDLGTIERHLEALKNDPELQRLYRLLADRAMRLAKKKEAAA
ncbi:MAG: F420-dependent NADP oxidoreductase [Candidatus Dormibacteraeota bacterium]|nr:F420-dependent NADP oxidoreductase [Candidatus Dormibacteraeota bacterium]